MIQEFQPFQENIELVEQNKFIYEIDKLKKDVELKSGNYYICTIISGNLRFIHFMTADGKENYFKQK